MIGSDTHLTTWIVLKHFLVACDFFPFYKKKIVQFYEHGLYMACIQYWEDIDQHSKEFHVKFCLPKTCNRVGIPVS